MKPHRTAARLIAGIVVATGLLVGTVAPAQAADTGWNGTRIVMKADTGWNGTR